MKIFLYNTLSHNKEEFIPLDDSNIRLYVCGPTVYDSPHIGNARSAVVFDILYRLLKIAYPKVTYVRNITDVDDKINAAALANGESIEALTLRTTKIYHDDIAALNVLSPNIEPRATAHIKEMIEIIESLIAKGHAYAKEDHVLFSVDSDANYGHLSRRSKDEMIAGARVEIAPYKKNPGDFVLWKPSSANEPGWDSPWGYGRPGWHIECSAMSSKYLGYNFDIHGGGADLQFPHHENEIAQSSCAFPGSKFAKYWVHNGFLTVNGEKMSKSLSNFITVRELLNQGIKGEVIRFALISSYYRKPLDWNEKLAFDSKKSLDKFYHSITKTGSSLELEQQFISHLADDMNISEAFALLHKMSNENLGDSLKKCGNMIGILEQQDWFSSLQEIDEAYINSKITERNEAKKAKNWALADQIRNELKDQGISLEDNADGTSYKIL